MPIFSSSLFKKGLKKKYLYPIGFVVFISLFFSQAIDQLFPSNFIGKRSLILSICLPSVLYLTSHYSQLLSYKEPFSFNRYLKSFFYQQGKINRMTFLPSLSFFFLFLGGFVFYLLESIPYLGPVLKLILCLGRLSIELMENSFILFFPFLISIWIQIHVEHKEAEHFHFLFQIERFLENRNQEFIQFFKGFFPLMLAIVLLFISEARVEKYEILSMQKWMNFIFIIPETLFFSPLIAYFFHSSLIIEEKHRIEKKSPFSRV